MPEASVCAPPPPNDLLGQGIDDDEVLFLMHVHIYPEAWFYCCETVLLFAPLRNELSTWPATCFPEKTMKHALQQTFSCDF